MIRIDPPLLEKGPGHPELHAVLQRRKSAEVEVERLSSKAARSSIMAEERRVVEGPAKRARPDPAREISRCALFKLINHL